MSEPATPRRAPDRIREGGSSMMIIEFDEGEGGSYGDRCDALLGLLEHLSTMEERGLIRNLYTTTDELEAEVAMVEDAMAERETATLN
jgi:hypothetical protein